MMLVDIQVDVLECVKLAVIEIEAARADLDLFSHVPEDSLRKSKCGNTHCLKPSLNMSRARMLISSTPRVIRKTPAQAICCQSLKGLIANLKIVTGKFAIGSRTSRLQNWLDRAVNTSGAVSPAMRATASKTPVTMPARAARAVI